ncbi:MAG: D-alanyl-D-alanine carboxypeptidase family protein [Dehalococcoidia bacterium]|nr:D-alanyl-D-alanine carboxypeptidase family protein [Dehalococcoidia bacterium]
MRPFTLLATLLLALVLGACIGGDDGGTPVIRTPTSPPTDEPTPTEAPTDTPDPAEPTATPEPTTAPTVTPAPTEPSDDDGGNGGNGDDAVVLACNPLAPVDKQHRLPADCAPNELVALPEPYTYGGEQLLVPVARDAVIELIDAAAEDGIELKARSSYRSYNTQVSTFNYWVDTLGREEASRVSAQPGHSEHQLGTTTDLTGPNAGYTLDGMPGTPEAEWIEQNAHRFGFVVSYPQGMEDVTGYVYEPWHIRFVGEDIANDVQQSGLTLAEYLHRRANAG